MCSRYLKRYIERELHKNKVRTQWHPLTGWKEIKLKKFKPNEFRPWTGDYQMAQKKGPIYVEPIKEWWIFKGDRVEILVGPDKGKQGIVNCIIKERNWVFVEGLNNKYEMESQNIGMPVCLRREQPLLVTTQVRLVDPSTEQGADIEWRYTEDGEKVRVSTTTGRIIPLPAGSKMLEELVIPSQYIEGKADTKEADLTKITFQPKLCTFEQDIMDEMGIEEKRSPARTYWY